MGSTRAIICDDCRLCSAQVQDSLDERSEGCSVHLCDAASYVPTKLGTVDSVQSLPWISVKLKFGDRSYGLKSKADALAEHQRGPVEIHG